MYLTVYFGGNPVWKMDLVVVTVVLCEIKLKKGHSDEILEILLEKALTL